MRRIVSLSRIGLVVFLWCCLGPAGAQESVGTAKAERAQGRTLGGSAIAPSLVSPEVHPDHRVTFRLHAPNAKTVTVSGDWEGGDTALTRDDSGVWSVTVGPLAADLFAYGFAVDGFETVDPANPVVKPMRSPRTSLLEIPADPPGLHEYQDVPHGTVCVHEYRSRALGRRRGLFVYTPPDYDKDPGARYPVLYLLHGNGNTEATWSVFGRAHLIADNLLAQGKLQPLIVVMPDGYAVPLSMPVSSSPAAAAVAERARNCAAFERDLLEDILPFVAASYRVRAEASSRALVGLAIGGVQALTIGLNHPDRFAWVGSFSAVPFDPATALAGALADPKATDSALRLVWIACGRNDRLVENARLLSGVLKVNGIRHEVHTMEDGRRWSLFRRYLAEILPLLFVTKP